MREASPRRPVGEPRRGIGTRHHPTQRRRKHGHDLLAIEPAVLENFISEARGLGPITFYKVFACSLISARYRQLGLNQSRLPSM